MTRPRAMPGVSVAMPSPVVVAGKPTVPLILGGSDSSGTTLEGPGHIHAIDNPDPWHAPDLPQPPVDSETGFKAIWRVHDLPSPAGFHDGWYWLGAPSGADGTSGITSDAQSWPASEGSSDGAPAWHSRYPFKPSVVAAQHWLYGGGTVDHPTAVNFNSQFIEHMWLDWGEARPQPFSWVVVAMLPNYPSWGYAQHLLDAGQNPFDVGLDGGYGADDCYNPRSIADGLDYRTLMTASPSRQRISTSGTRGLSAPHHANVRPRMYYGVYDGSSSAVGNYTSAASFRHRGSVADGAGYHHRYTVIGRKQNRLSQADASHLLVFEIRYYAKALTEDHLKDLFDHFNSVYKMGRY